MSLSKLPHSFKHKVGEYQLGNCIGKGAYGQVFKGINPDTGEVVAIKQVDIQFVGEAELDSIMGEINLLTDLTHPNIVRYVASVQTTEKLNIILEFVEEGSLTGVLKRGKKLQEDVISRYVKQMLEGLNYLHAKGVVHCDIKCANILISRSGAIKLTDFGVSKKLKNEELENDVVGTPFWMAPEVIQLQGATPASDIWSLGCTVIELLTGNPPYHEQQSMSAMYHIVEDDHPPFPADISKDMEDFLLKIFQKSPNERWTAQQLLQHPFIVAGGKKKTPPSQSAPFLKISKNRTDDEIKMAFDLLDPESTGSVSRANALLLLRGLGCGVKNSHFNSLVQSKKLGESIPFPVFCQLFRELPIEANDEVKKAFKTFDPSSTGLISVSKLRSLVTQAGEAMSTEEFNSVISEFGVDSDGNFDYGAWIEMTLS